MVPRGGASGGVEIYLGVWNAGGGKGVFDAGADFCYVEGGYFDGGEAAGEPLEVLVECEDFAVIASDDLINAVSEEGSAVEVGGLKLVHWDDSVVYHGYLHKHCS